jgi:predicted acyl esterase
MCQDDGAVEHNHVWLTMSDGIRLAARLWLPGERPAPALLEALPYRMDDLTASYAADYERLCEEGGFAVCRVDIRGTGSSEGVAEDEYTPAEHSDLCEVIAWLARQEWSNGRVGMFGTSWSGFNSIQLATLRPPELRAIVPIYATDDRYTDDVHYMGGAVKAADLVDWVLYMVASNALPPVPALAGEDWREQWKARLEQTTPWLLRWLEEQTDGPYWRHGSLRPDYERVACPTMIVAGWADGYRNNTFRTFAALRCPKRLLVGPWSHMSPAASLPGPRVDLVSELIRWFARWLRDERNGIDEEPPIVVFARRSTRPAPDLARVRGEWRAEPVWPPERLVERVLRPPGAGQDTIEVRGDTGVRAWNSCAGRLPWGLPDDQRTDDALSLTYDWDPLSADLEIMGYPTLRLTVTSPVPVPYLSARLCDVFPDGVSALVTRGVLVLTHRESHAHPTPFPVGVPTPIEIELEATSWTLETGHRLRLALAGADWPNVWPPPAGGLLVVDRASVALTLPVLEGPQVLSAPTLPSPPAEDAQLHGSVKAEPITWRLEHDVLGGETRAVTAYGSAYDGLFGASCEERYDGTVGVSTADPALAWAKGRAAYRVTWPEADVQTEALLDMRSDAQSYHVTVGLVAEELAGAGIGRFERRWERTIPRRLV